jgi:membrane-associated phospholipid phosphatase
MLGFVVAAFLAQSSPEGLAWNPKIDLPVTGALGAGWLISEFAVKKQLAPAQCRWCATNALDDGVRSIFHPNVGVSGLSGADTASNVAWGAAAVATLGVDALLAWRDGAVADFPVDAVIVFEATFAAMALNQTVKFAVGRERPFVSHLSAEDKPLTAAPSDNNLSFFSGHATFTMSLAVATGTVARLRGYRMGWLVWAVGVPFSLVTGVLRLAADKHYFTDVLVGWVVGAGIGFSVPWLFHQPDNSLALRLVPSPGGIAIAGRL